MITTPAMPRVTAMIADDESLARAKLREFLAAAPSIEVIGESSSGPTTVALVNHLRPRLLFLDVRMPGLDGFQVLDRLVHRPAVVFTTAHDEYAVSAFEVRALDYLLKPFGRARFENALGRALESIDHGSGATPPTSADHMASSTAMSPSGHPALRQLFVRAGRRIVPVDVSQVARFEASDDYVTLYTGDKPLLASMTMDELESRLDSLKFLRIHRSHIVNLEAVTSIVPHASGRFLVSMRDGTRLFASRSRSREVRRKAV